MLLPELPFQPKWCATSCNQDGGWSWHCLACGRADRGSDAVVARQLQGSPDPIRLGDRALVADLVEREQALKPNHGAGPCATRRRGGPGARDPVRSRPSNSFSKAENQSWCSEQHDSAHRPHGGHRKAETGSDRSPAHRAADDWRRALGCGRAENSDEVNGSRSDPTNGSNRFRNAATSIPAKSAANTLDDLVGRKVVLRKRIIPTGNGVGRGIDIHTPHPHAAGVCIQHVQEGKRNKPATCIVTSAPPPPSRRYFAAA